MISSVGATVAELGIVLFVAANSDRMPRPTRVVLLLVLVAAAYAAGYALRERRETHPHVGEALYLLGGLAFAAEIFLVGQMYHVDARWPLAFLAISLLTGAVAAVVRAQALAALSLVASASGRSRSCSSSTATRGSRAGCGGAVRLRALRPRDRRPRRPRPGRLPHADARARPAAGARRHVRVHVRAGPPCRLGRRGRRAGAGGPRRACRCGRRGRRRPRHAARRRRTAPWEAAGLLASTFLVVLAVLAPESTPDGGAVFYPILFNLLFAALALGTIVVGYVEDEPALVAVGIVAVGVDVLARYVDVFWDFLPRSIGFVGAGLLLLGLAWLLERQRSRLVGSMR